MTPDRTEPHDRVLALLVGVLHGVGQELAQRRRTEAFLVHRRNDVLGRHVLAEVEELDLERLLVLLVVGVLEVLRRDVVVLPVERTLGNGLFERRVVVDEEQFDPLLDGDLASHDQLRDLGGQLLVLEDAQDVFVVAAHVEHGVDECLDDLKHFAKALEQFTCGTSHLEPLSSVWPTAYPSHPTQTYGLPTANRFGCSN